MIEIYACTAIICAASLVLGAAILRACRWRGPLWLAGATGFAALVVVAPFLIRLPGRGTTAAAVIGLLLAASAAIVWRGRPQEGWPRAALVTGGVTAVAAVGLASLPFFFQDHVGVLGEGIYINDHAAQLYWADWLQHGFGPEPNAVAFGYPIGPQALVATLGTATGIDLISAFNGLLLAIPALTALTALAALGRLVAAPRVLAAVLAAVCFLAASFLAQSAFKETAMALLVLAFAIGLQELRGRALVVSGLVLAAGAVLTYSIPGLAWFAVAVPLWLVLEALAGRSPIDYGVLGATVSRHRLVVAVVGLVGVAVVAIAIGPAANFIEKIDEVQTSLGRLGSPIFPGEVFGIWPEGDFRIVRGEVSGSLIAAALGLAAAGFGAWVLWRHRELALLATLVTGGIVYAGARLFAEIHVEAKALAIAAPVVLLVGLRALLARREGEEPGGIASARWAAGTLVAVAALGSTLLALRAAPVGFDQRGQALERFAERIGEDTVVFLGVDRFAGYYLRGTLARAPAGYVPEEVEPREDKPWRQGYAVDFDTLDAGKLDQFDWAITTAAEFNSQPPPNFERVAEERDYVLWRRTGPTPQSRIVAAPKIPVSNPWLTDYETNGPGGTLRCTGADAPSVERGGAAVVRPRPVVLPPRAWSGAAVEPAAGGQERGFSADEPIVAHLSAPAEELRLSLQYHSQVPLTVLYDDEIVAELPPSLEGMYFDGAGRGAFWPAGTILGAADAVLEIVPEAPEGLRDALGVENRVWLGQVAATPVSAPHQVPVTQACERYVDHFTLERGAGG